MSAHATFGATDFPDHITSVEGARTLIESRPDFTAVYLNYTDVVANPLVEFTKLADAGWPINAAKAAAIPTDKLYRNRV